MAIVLGLVAALAYGLGDFIAGVLSRRMHYALVALIANAVAAPLSLIVLIVTSPAAPTTMALAWGAASGIGSGLGTLMLFRGLGRGRMGIVAPLSAVGAAALPVLVGVGLGDRPSLPAWVGVLLALPAIWMASTAEQSSGDDVARPTGRSVLASGALDGLLAGIGFALLFVGLNLAGDGAGLWPVVASQWSALLVLALVATGTMGALDRIRLPRPQAFGAGCVGIVGTAASLSYFLSSQAGLLSIMAVLTSLYPAVTILLARLVLHERINRRQAAGLVLAGAAVGLIAVA